MIKTKKEFGKLLKLWFKREFEDKEVEFYKNLYNKTYKDKKVREYLDENRYYKSVWENIFSTLKNNLKKENEENKWQFVSNAVKLKAMLDYFKLVLINNK